MCGTPQMRSWIAWVQKAEVTHRSVSAEHSGARTHAEASIGGSCLSNHEDRHGRALAAAQKDFALRRFHTDHSIAAQKRRALGGHGRNGSSAGLGNLTFRVQAKPLRVDAHDTSNTL